jgi:glycolate permease
MSRVLMLAWSQPLYPTGSMTISALAAAAPLVLVLTLMGGFRKSGLTASLWGLGLAALLALFAWGMPPLMVGWSIAHGFAYALWPIMWIVFAGLWLYNLCVHTGKFELLRQWMAEHASGDPCIQALLVAFCFGALLESCAGFGAPVAVTSCLLAGLGFEPRRAVIVALIANTAPVGFGGMGIPIVALRDATQLDLGKLSAMVGRQLPFLSLIVPAFLVWFVGGSKGVKRVWPATVVCGGSYALVQFLVSNFWGPYAADIVAACVSIAALVAFLRVWKPPTVDATPAVVPGSVQSVHIKAGPEGLSIQDSFSAWLPWVLLTLVMIGWSVLKLFRKGELAIHLRPLEQIFITLYQKPYSAIYYFRPLEVGTAVVVATVLAGLCLRASWKTSFHAAAQSLQQVRLPTVTVMLIVGLAYLYNYSGMAYTLGAAMAHLGTAFPIASSFLGWIACFLSGSDTASNLLFGNLQVAAAEQLHLSPVLLAATNSSGGVISKMISPQNIAVGVTTLGLVGQEGRILRSTFWPSVILAALLGLLSYAQAYWMPWMIP